MNSFNYYKASSLGDACATANERDESSFIAGGTNFVDLWKYNLVNPELVIDINGLRVSTIEELGNGGVRLNAFASNADTAYHPLIEDRYPLLSKAILAGASAQIRNMATNGGNLMQRTRCYYFYDADVPCNKRSPGAGCPAIQGYQRMHAILGASEHCIAVFPSDMSVALAALDATINITGSAGKRTSSFEAFHRLPGDTPHIDNNLQPGEIITSIDLPAAGFASNYSYLKVRDRNSYAFALVSVATGLELNGDTIQQARIALGGVAHKPWRVKDAEEFLHGKRAVEHNFEEAANILLRGARGFKHNSFKIELARRAIIRNGMMALNPESQRPGSQPS